MSNYNFSVLNKISACVLAFSILGCSGSNKGSETAGDSMSPSIQVDSVDSLIVLNDEPEEPKDTLPEYRFDDSEAALDFIANRPESSSYEGGIIPVIAREVPSYAAKLMTQLEKYSSFIVVDKASMRVILYDKYGQEKKAYGMACAKNYGTKHKKADSRTPEGFFSLEGKYNSTDWLYTDDYGHTSQKKGQFGPRFLRIKTPVTMQVGIHGTCSPWSIGHRASHGCIRIKNDDILELYGLAEVGCPVIVLPGKRDRAVNRQEGYDIPFFPTMDKYAMSDKEASEPLTTKTANNSAAMNASEDMKDDGAGKAANQEKEVKTEDTPASPSKPKTEPAEPADSTVNMYF